MTTIIPSGTSDATFPDAPTDKRPRAGTRRAVPLQDLTAQERERLEWELFGTSWPEPQPKTGLERFEVLAHKALDVVFKRLKRWV